jgi:hypothetical protein
MSKWVTDKPRWKRLHNVLKPPQFVFPVSQI